MNATSMAQRAYAPTSAPIRTSRSVEYDVIGRITHRLKEAIQEGEMPGLIEVLYENRKLWRALAMDVADPANPLPKDLKARIFYLYEFTDHHTSLVIRGKQKATPLLEVNIAILRGLKGEGAVA